ncbi:glycine-rich domain-containing protein, partial [Algoriphagus chordae]
MIFSLGEVKGQCVITENTAGVHTFIVPAGVTEITVETWGAGGRGGSRTNNGGSGGGGGGGYSRSIISVTPGETYSYTVGAGGAVGSINGGISRFYLGATDHVLANGGIGTNNNSNTAGTGATTSGAIGNQETKPGGAGASGNTSRGGGGGSSGNLGENGVAGSGSTGGSHTVGVGDGGNGGTGTNDNGDPGNAPGGGGGGAIRDCIGWGCSDLEGGNGANGRVQITFRPTPTFSVSPTVNVCEDVEDVVYTTQSDAAISNYDWSLPGTAGIDFSIEAGGISISDHTVTVRWLTPGPKAVTVNYTVTAYGVSCDGESPASSTVTVDPVTRIETNLSTTAPPIVCEGGSFPALSVTASGTGTLSYQWYSNTSANTTGGTTIGTDSPTFTPPATTTGDLYYYVEVTGDCGPVATSLVSGVHTVTPLTTITTQPIGDAYCQNEAPTDLVVAATGTGIIDIEWFSNSSNSTTGATSVGTGTTFTPPTTTAETTYYFAVAASATCGSITSDIVEIEVTPETTIDTHPIGSVYCQNETPTDLSVVATGTGSIAYEWFSNTSNSTIGATSVGTG